jgi:hypothetical protein
MHRGSRTYKIIVLKTQRKIPLMLLIYNQEDSIRMDLKEVDCEDMN